ACPRRNRPADRARVSPPRYDVPTRPARAAAPSSWCAERGVHPPDAEAATVRSGHLRELVRTRPGGHPRPRGRRVVRADPGVRGGVVGADWGVGGGGVISFSAAFSREFGHIG